MSTPCRSPVVHSLAVLTALLPAIAVPAAEAVEVPPIPSPATVLSVSPTRTNLHVELRGDVCRSPNILYEGSLSADE